VPYLSPNKFNLIAWRNKLLDYNILQKPMIVIVNRGTPMHGNDINRSISLDKFESIVTNPNYSFVVLDHLAKDQAWLTCGKIKLQNLSVNVENFDDAASIIELATKVISVDSAPLHLAGALGKEAWGLIPFVHDWRWICGKEDTPWYPTMTLFRQKKLGDWTSVLDSISKALLLMPSEK
jgi:ADP-heptose:LPS heptosyltransferase